MSENAPVGYQPAYGYENGGHKLQLRPRGNAYAYYFDGVFRGDFINLEAALETIHTEKAWPEFPDPFMPPRSLDDWKVE